MTKKIDAVMKFYKEYIVPTYTQSPLCIVKGEGARVWDIDGGEYLDFFPGWAVSGLGHCPKRVVDAARKQAGTIIHVSNNYMNEIQPELAKKIIGHSFGGKVFFANSGAEANEAAIKLARKYGGPERFEIITMEKSFHGRTLATITATGQDKVKKGFAPLPKGFITVPFNDIDALKSAASGKTVAIMLELIQGEGGINIADKDYIEKIKELCDKKDLLLIFDEVQTGLGRTGEMFAYKHYGITPDMMTLAKSLGGGVPIGAMVASSRIADVLGPGSHASTFGGSPLVCAASLAVFGSIEKDKLLDNTRKMGSYFTQRLNKLGEKFSFIKEVRGLGLMLGVELSIDGGPIFKSCFDKGLLINCTQTNILRIMPPLIITKKEIDKGLDILEEALGESNA
jgi:predicted acetylornithine/succinylornithine family transaminase